jgi:hypothetical protein
LLACYCICLLLHLLYVVSFCYYRCAIFVGIRIVCLLYKFVHGADYLQCNEMFIINKSFVNMVLHEFVVVNVVFRTQIQWPCGEDLLRVMAGFNDWCGLPFIQGAIDCTYIHI